jgi:hypothetical protein
MNIENFSIFNYVSTTYSAGIRLWIMVREGRRCNVKGERREAGGNPLAFYLFTFYLTPSLAKPLHANNLLS